MGVKSRLKKLDYFYIGVLFFISGLLLVYVKNQARENSAHIYNCKKIIDVSRADNIILVVYEDLDGKNKVTRRDTIDNIECVDKKQSILKSILDYFHIGVLFFISGLLLVYVKN